MEIIRVEDLTERYREEKSILQKPLWNMMFMPIIGQYHEDNFCRILRFVIKNNNLIDFIQYHECEDHSYSYYSRCPIRLKSIEEFCDRFHKEFKKGTPLEDILKMDTENILGYKQDTQILTKSKKGL